MEKKTKGPAERRGKLHKMFLQGARCTIDKLAERLISIPCAEEVYVSDDELGYLIRMRFLEGKEPKDAIRYISHRLSQRPGHLIECR